MDTMSKQQEGINMFLFYSLVRRWDQEAIGSCVVLQKKQSHGKADRSKFKCDFWQVNSPLYADDMISCLSRKQNPIKPNFLPLSVEIYIQRTKSGQEIIISLDICLQLCVACSSSWGLGWIMQETSKWPALSTSRVRLKTGRKKPHEKRERTVKAWVLEKVWILKYLLLRVRETSLRDLSKYLCQA